MMGLGGCVAAVWCLAAVSGWQAASVWTSNCGNGLVHAARDRLTGPNLNGFENRSPETRDYFEQRKEYIRLGKVREVLVATLNFEIGSGGWLTVSLVIEGSKSGVHGDHGGGSDGGLGGK